MGVVFLRSRQGLRWTRDSAGDVPQEALAAQVGQDLGLPQEEVVTRQFDGNELAIVA
jgi:hypothetical protein